MDNVCKLRLAAAHAFSSGLQVPRLSRMLANTIAPEITKALLQNATASHDIFGLSISSAVSPIHDALSAIRTHLGMDVAYLSEFVQGRSVFRQVDAPGLEALIKVGDSHSLDDVYCNHILEGRLPELMADTADWPLAAGMPITSAVPIGSHASIPIPLADGTPYGMFCCLSPRANPSLNLRDLEMMRVFAGIAAKQVNAELESSLARRSARTRIEEMLRSRAFSIAWQPIVDLTTHEVRAYEALTRFESVPYQTPDRWFNDAKSAGLGVDLELAAISLAIAAFADVPERVNISVNASSDAIMSGRLVEALDARYMHRTVLEVTEHAPVQDFTVLHDALAPLKAKGLRVAVDDAGAGYAGLQHIVQLAPDVIKLDMSLTRGIDTDQALCALVTAITYFARETGAIVVAEGIETPAERDRLRSLGVDRGQGYLLGRPGALPAISGQPSSVA